MNIKPTHRNWYYTCIQMWWPAAGVSVVEGTVADKYLVGGIMADNELQGQSCVYRQRC